MAEKEIGTKKLIKTWASQGTKTQPDHAKFQEGWAFGEQPPREWVNYLYNQFGAQANYFLQKGLSEWDNETPYGENSFVQHNGRIWRATTINEDSEPAFGNGDWIDILEAKNLDFDPSSSSLDAENLQDAIEELSDDVDDLLQESDDATSNETPNTLVKRNAQGTAKFGAPTDAKHAIRKEEFDALTAAQVEYNPSGTGLSSTDVQGGITELSGQVSAMGSATISNDAPDPNSVGDSGALWFQKQEFFTVLDLVFANELELFSALSGMENFDDNYTQKDTVTNKFVNVSKYSVFDEDFFFRFVVFDDDLNIEKNLFIQYGSNSNLASSFSSFYAVKDQKVFIVNRYMDFMSNHTTDTKVYDLSGSSISVIDNSSALNDSGTASRPFLYQDDDDIYVVHEQESVLYRYDFTDNRVSIGPISTTTASGNLIKGVTGNENFIFYFSNDFVYRIEKNGDNDTTLTLSGKDNFEKIAADNEQLYVLCEDSGQQQILMINQDTLDINETIDVDVFGSNGDLKVVSNTLIYQKNNTDLFLYNTENGDLRAEKTISEISGFNQNLQNITFYDDKFVIFSQSVYANGTVYVSPVSLTEVEVEEDPIIINKWVADAGVWNKFYSKAETILFDQQKITTKADHLQDLLEKYDKNFFSLSTNIYSVSQDQTVKKFNGFLTLEDWSFTGHSGTVLGVAVDAQGFVYSGSADNTVRKINPNGVEVWSFTGHSSAVRAVAVDAQGVVYSGSSDNTVRKISPAGNQVWSFFGHSNWVYKVAVDAQGFVYSGSSDNTLRKINPNGVEVWSFTGHTDNVLGVAVDAQGFVYSGSSDTTVRKIDPDGVEVWSFTGNSGWVWGVAVDAQGFVYSASGDNTVRKIDSDGNQVWRFTGHSFDVEAVAVDAQGFVYSASIDQTVRKIDSDGNQVWSFTGHSNNVLGVAVSPGLLGAGFWED